jgi:DNA topoisomerase-1
MAAAKYKLREAVINAPMDYLYSNMIEIPVFLGWKVIETKDSESKGISTAEQNQGSGLLLYLESIVNAKSPVHNNKIESSLKIHNKHSYYTEASLIQKLEELGIGRPSTFASLVDTIIDRGYVKKTNIDGTTYECNDYILHNGVITKSTVQKTFGAEKNKLVIQHTGVLSLEFLLQNFENIFNYEYTKQMEEQLDIISSQSNGEIPWYDLCKKCLREIKEKTQSLKTIEKKIYKINDEYDLVFQKFGPVLRTKTIEATTGENEYIYKAIKQSMVVDLEKLERNEYTLDDLIEIKNDYLGDYQNEKLYIKTGTYGPYVQWGDNRQSIKNIDKDLNSITIEDIIQYLERDINSPENMLRTLKQNKKILRIIDTDTSIRKGKYGAYVYYKTGIMKTPEFYNLTKFKKGFNTCNIEEIKTWLKETYNIPK